MIVDYDGRIMSQADPGPGEQIVVGPVALAALRHERERRRGHHMLSHLRTETYTGYQHPIFPHASCAEPPTIQSNEERIAEGRKRLRGD